MKTINLKYHLQREMKNLIYHMDCILYFEYIIKKHKVMTDYSPIRIYVNKIENRISFRIKTGYYLELVMPETMKLLGNTKKK